MSASNDSRALCQACNALIPSTPPLHPQAMGATRRRLWGLLLPLVLASLLKLVTSATALAKRLPQQASPPAYPTLPDVDEENEKAAGEAVIQLAEALVNIESLSGREHAMAHALQEWLSKRGWQVVMQPVPAAAGHEKVVRKW